MKSKNYFTKDTQLAIEEMQAEPDYKERELIFRSRVLPAFEKLVENLIHVYGFKSGAGTADTLERMKYDCVTFLYETTHKWDPERGSKAFSYFNVVAKNWLIGQTNKRKKKQTRIAYIDDVESLSAKDRRKIETQNYVPAPDSIVSSEEIRMVISNMLQEFKRVANPGNETTTILAIEKVFESIDELELLNKRAIYVYLKEISGLSSSQLSSGLSNVRKRYRQLTDKQGFFSPDFWESMEALSVEDESEEEDE